MRIELEDSVDNSPQECCTFQSLSRHRAPRLVHLRDPLRILQISYISKISLNLKHKCRITGPMSSAQVQFEDRCALFVPALSPISLIRYRKNESSSGRSGAIVSEKCSQECVVARVQVWTNVFCPDFKCFLNHAYCDVLSNSSYRDVQQLHWRKRDRH